MTARLMSVLALPLSLLLSQTALAHPSLMPHIFHLDSGLSYALAALVVVAVVFAIVLFRKILLAVE